MTTPILIECELWSNPPGSSRARIAGRGLRARLRAPRRNRCTRRLPAAEAGPPDGERASEALVRLAVRPSPPARRPTHSCPPRNRPEEGMVGPDYRLGLEYNQTNQTRGMRSEHSPFVVNVKTKQFGRNLWSRKDSTGGRTPVARRTLPTSVCACVTPCG